MILIELLKVQKCQVPSKSQRVCLQGSPWKPESSSPKESCICTENACEGFRVFRNAEVFNPDYHSRSILVSCDRVDEAADVLEKLRSTPAPGASALDAMFRLTSSLVTRVKCCSCAACVISVSHAEVLAV